MESRTNPVFIKRSRYIDIGWNKSQSMSTLKTLKYYLGFSIRCQKIYNRNNWILFDNNISKIIIIRGWIIGRLWGFNNKWPLCSTFSGSMYVICLIDEDDGLVISQFSLKMFQCLLSHNFVKSCTSSEYEVQEFSNKYYSLYFTFDTVKDWVHPQPLQFSTYTNFRYVRNSGFDNVDQSNNNTINVNILNTANT